MVILYIVHIVQAIAASRICWCCMYTRAIVSMVECLLFDCIEATTAADIHSGVKKKGISERLWQLLFELAAGVSYDCRYVRIYMAKVATNPIQSHHPFNFWLFYFLLCFRRFFIEQLTNWPTDQAITADQEREPTKQESWPKYEWMD